MRNSQQMIEKSLIFCCHMNKREQPLSRPSTKKVRGKRCFSLLPDGPPSAVSAQLCPPQNAYKAPPNGGL